MPNRFFSDEGWASYRTPVGNPGGWPPEGYLYTRDVSSNDRIAVTHEDDHDEQMAATTNPTSTADPQLPRIRFTRSIYDHGSIVGSITYLGWMVRERTPPRKSIIYGTYSINTVGHAALLSDEVGDWTANRPPPGPGPKRQSTSGKKATAGSAKKTASPKKPAKLQKSSAKKGASVKQPARSPKEKKR